MSSLRLRLPAVNYIPALWLLFYVHTLPGSPAGPLRAAKCVVPNGLEHVSRAALLQQCISENYGQGNETRCYPELGCFPMDSPWTTTLRPFPSPLPPEEINVRLYCYTRASPERFNVSLWPEMSLAGCPLDVSKPVVFITHGFASNGNGSWLSDMKDNYLHKVDATVLLVDWGQGAQLLNYLQVASNTRIAGAELGRFLKYLGAEHKLKPDKVHLIGHSLGSHISSYAAKAFPEIGRLTALDPAQPGFEGQDQIVGLHKSDAAFVDVLHTNAAPFIPTLGFGLILPTGDADFYMNGGPRQPGCIIPEVPNIKSINDLAKYPVEVVNTWVSCSHGRAYEYFTEALKSNCTIWGHQADVSRRLLSATTLGIIDPAVSKVENCTAENCLPVGLEAVNFPARGSFVASTNARPPYCDTDPAVTKRVISEVKVLSSGASTKVLDAVDGGVGKSKDVASGAIGKVRSLSFI